MTDTDKITEIMARVVRLMDTDMDSHIKMCAAIHEAADYIDQLEALMEEAKQALREQQSEIERLKALPYEVLEIMTEHDISPRIAREIVDLMTIHKMSAKQVWDTYGDRQI